MSIAIKEAIKKYNTEKTIGCTESQILCIQEQVDNLRIHLSRNLLDPELTSNTKTHRKDVPAINSLKKKIHQIRSLISYLKRKKENYTSFIKTAQEFGISLEKHH